MRVEHVISECVSNFATLDVQNLYPCILRNEGRKYSQQRLILKRVERNQLDKFTKATLSIESTLSIVLRAHSIFSL